MSSAATTSASLLNPKSLLDTDVVLASTPLFDIRSVRGCMAVVRFIGSPSEATWAEYAAAYQRMYTTMRQFVLVFDMRAIGFPPLGVLQAKVKMLQSLKAQTARQVMGAVVLTSSMLIAGFVTEVARSSGQVSPFFVTTDVDQAASYACRLAAIGLGCRRALPITPSETPLRWKDVPPTCAFALSIMSFIRVTRHFMREASRRRGLRYL